MSRSLEAPFLKVPLQQLSSSVRAHKTLQTELGHILEDAVQLQCGTSLAAHGEADAAADGAAAAHARKLGKVSARLQRFKRKLVEVKQRETEHVQRLCYGVQRLRQSDRAARQDTTEGQDDRDDLAIVDYMLREGNCRTAERLAAASAPGTAALANGELFRGMHSVVQSLTQQRDCAHALAWCQKHKSALQKKPESAAAGFEFALRVQSLIELARAGKRVEAITYARAHLKAALQLQHGVQTKQSAERRVVARRVMGLLAFSVHDEHSPYQNLYSLGRWDTLATQFKHSFFAVYGLGEAAPLSAMLRCGLSALMPPPWASALTSPGVGRRGVRSPFASEAVRGLAAGLHITPHTHSCLVCRISGDIMNSDNPPTVLPNGQVYSLAALHELAAASDNNQTIVCPTTGLECALDELRQAFVI